MHSVHFFMRQPGLQNSLLGSIGPFEMIGGRKEFVQVLHSNNDHWLTISIINCYSVVKVYDSMIPLSTKQQICSILMSTECLISVEFVAVDRQNNSNYCAWSFRVSFCHCSLCWGRTPVLALQHRRYIHTGPFTTVFREWYDTTLSF